MNSKKLFGALLCSVVALGGFAQQPFGGCWHPEYVANWTPEADPDAKFNRSLVKLQPRIEDDGIKANANQYPDAKIGACLTMNPQCSTTPAQGANNFIGYNPTYWQYMDLIVWWGGSAGEGIIVPPSAPFTDVCHMNGVKVLGNVFFPPTAFSGDPEWVHQFLQEENGTYPVAKKMYEIAKYYGFDGWFLNEETNASEDAQWEGWIKYFYECAEADGNYDMELQWYDAGWFADDAISIITAHDNVSFMANYGSATTDMINRNTSDIMSQGYTQEEVFSKLYSGIEAAQNGLNGNGPEFAAAFPTSGHTSSMQIFNPEEHIWKQVVEDLLNTENACGRQAYDAIETVFANESRYWVNVQGDPSNTEARSTSATWAGLANAIQERSTIMSKPFVTSFSGGQGKFRFVEGEKQGTQDWYHRGMQSIMPTWRWWVETSSSDQLTFTLDWDDAFNIGTSILVKGNMTAGADHLTRLYKTRLAIESGDKFQLVYKTSTANSIELQLGVAENGNAFTKFPLSETRNVNGWTVAEVDLSSLAGKTVSIIALNFKTSSAVSSYEARLGQLGIFPSSYSESLQVSNLEVQNELGDEITDLRIVWDAPSNYDEVDHFDVYLERSGVRTLVGQTRDEAFYVPDFTRGDGEASVKVSVVTVTKDMKQGQEVSVTKNYPAMSAPEVSIVASPTLVKVGENVTLTAIANKKPQTYDWVFPSNAEVVSQGTNMAIVKFNAEGLYSVTAKVGNEVGVTEKTENNLIEVSNTKTLDNVAQGKTIHSVSGEIAASGEVADNILDGRVTGVGVHGKWCVGGSKEHWVIIDLEQPYQLYWFRIADADVNEPGYGNLDCYRIELSNDLNSWTEVVNTSGRSDEMYHVDWIKPTVARYVRFVPYDEDEPITIRIWEFEAYGAESELQLGNVSTQTMETNSTAEVTGTFVLGNEGKEDNFAITATSDNEDVVTVSNVSVDEAAGTYTVALASTGLANRANVTVTLTNGQYQVFTTFEVNVTDPSNENLVLNVLPTVTESGAGMGAPVSRGEIADMTDGDYTSYYAPDYGDEAAVTRIEFDLGGLKEVSSVAMRLGYDDSDVADLRVPVSIEVETSADGTSFTKWTDLEPSRDIRYAAVESVKASKIAFDIVLNYWASAQIFEIEVFGKDATGQGINDAAAATVSVVPTVVDGGEAVTVSGEGIQTVKVVSLQGVVVKTVGVAGDVTTVGTGDLAAGTYLMVVGGEGYNKVVKFVVR